MANCVIFCAAGFDGLLAPIGAEDFIIAADGGLRHTQALGLAPHAVIGDFDSLGFTPEGAEVFPVEKDDTDSMLAIRMALERGFKTVLLYGAMDGPRLDHTVANFQALQFLADHGGRGYIIGNRQVATVIRNEEVRFPDGASGDFSVFAFGGNAEGVSLKGLYYPLEGAVLTPGFPLGVSNHFTGKAAAVQVCKGSLLLLWSREAGLPEGVL